MVSFKNGAFGEYDLIFAGGGTTACVTAGRLAAADPTLKILVLEAGPHTIDVPHVESPGLFIKHLLPASDTVVLYKANPGKDINNTTPTVITGGCVGGGSSINFMVYTRGAVSDYDTWRDVYGNDGWGFEDLLPLLRKSETYQLDSESPTHGYCGPLKVSHGSMVPNYTVHAMEMVSQYDKERGITDDSNDLHVVDRWSRWQKWIDANTGKRSDVASNFIYNQTHNQNLVVAEKSRVLRVVIEDGRAIGVEYLHSARPSTSEVKSATFARANKMVIISAGAFGSPAILERSGIGAKGILQACNIEQIVDLPGVGAEFQDHQFIAQLCAVDESAETRDLLYIMDPGALEEWKKTGTGILSTNTIDVAIKIRPNAQDLETLGPAFQRRWKDHFEGKPDKGLAWIGTGTGLPAYYADLPSGYKFAFFAEWSMYPFSRGHVHIKSSDIDEPQDFESGLLNDPIDLDVLRWAYKRGREYFRRHPMYRGEIQASHPRFTECSAAAVQAPPALPAAIQSPNLVYSAEDDMAIDDYIKTSITTVYHSLGTCPMKPRQRGGVVDSALNVYGVRCLKVADMSIAPSNVGANTNSSAILIGEKAAIIIAKELALQNV